METKKPVTLQKICKLLAFCIYSDFLFLPSKTDKKIGRNQSLLLRLVV